jgi:transposase-like protein
MRSIPTQNRRAALLREFEQSGLSMAAFCRQWGLGYSTLGAWRRAARVGRLGSTGHESAPRFVEIEAVMPEAGGWRQPDCGEELPKAQPAPGALVAELALPGGAVLRIFQEAAQTQAGRQGGVP